MRDKLPIGLIFSVTGPYSAVSSSMLSGALLAIDEVNADESFGFTLEARAVDPKGKNESYRTYCETMLKRQGIRHIVGCYTSISRKEVIPYFEKYDGILWYPSHYEGFETSDNVIYTGAAPNQHIIPLARYMMSDFGTRAYCIGSNYIWAWENNRILREVLTACGGEIVAEKYIPVGSIDVAHLVEDIQRHKPDFVYSTLIGDSRYALVKAMQSAGTTEKEAWARPIPICDCSLSEPELLEIGPSASPGLIASSVYFQSVATQKNFSFVSRYKKRFGQESITSADAEASYIAVLLLANALREAGTEAIDAVRRAALGSSIDAPQGQVTIDPENAHCYLTPRLARAKNHQEFDIFWEAKEPIKPDPYLVWLDIDKDAQRSLDDPLPDMASELRRKLRLVK